MQRNGTMYKLLTCSVVLSIILGGFLFGGCDRSTQSQPPPTVPEVAIVTVKPQKIILTTELPGRTTALRIAEIRPQVNGLIQKRLFREGSDVKAGQLLYQIDQAPFQAAIHSAKANLAAMQKSADRARAALEASIAGVTRQRATLDLARTNRERFEEVFRDGAVSTSQRDQAVTEAAVAEAALRAAEAQVKSDRTAIAAAEAGIEQAEAALETARINLGYTKITAPIPGRIGRSNVTVGAIVTAYQPMALATGTLQFRDVTVDPTTGSVILRAVFPNPEDILLPGMFVRAVVKEGVSEQAILVPQQSVSRDPKGDPFVLIVNDEAKVRQRMITIDRAVGSRWLVSSGLDPGDRVIVEGAQRARPGASVNAVPFDAGQGDGPASQDKHKPSSPKK